MLDFFDVQSDILRSIYNAMRDNSSDTPGVIIFPPLIPLTVLVVGIILNFLLPLDLLTHVPLTATIRLHLTARLINSMDDNRRCSLSRRFHGCESVATLKLLWLDRTGGGGNSLASLRYRSSLLATGEQFQIPLLAGE